jgi:hypothetical protein
LGYSASTILGDVTLENQHLRRFMAEFKPTLDDWMVCEIDDGQSVSRTSIVVKSKRLFYRDSLGK